RLDHVDLEHSLAPSSQISRLASGNHAGGFQRRLFVVRQPEQITQDVVVVAPQGRRWPQGASPAGIVHPGKSDAPRSVFDLPEDVALSQVLIGKQVTNAAGGCAWHV